VGVAGLAALAAPPPASAAAPDVHALTGVRIVVAPGRVIERGTVVLRDGLIEAVGEGVEPPPDARVWERDGLTVYPGLIEPYAVRSWPEGESEGEDAPEQRAAAPNPVVHPEREMAVFAADESADARLREAGFTAAAIAPRGGLLRGRSVLLGLGEAPVRDRILIPRLAQNVTLGAIAEGGYPNSLMGSVALARESFLEADWYRRAQAAYRANPAQRRPGYDASLEALGPAAAGEEPVVLESEDLLGVLRSARLAEELGLRAWLVGSGVEYRRLELVAELAGRLDAPMVVPVAFPEAPEVGADPVDLDLDTLRHWKAAPGNPAALVEAGVTVAVTSHRLDQPKQLHARMATAVEAGLSPEDALAALTTVPARLLGVADRLGTVEPGKIANLVVLEGDLFREETAIQEVWVDGRRIEIEEIEPPAVEPAGTWELQVDTGDNQLPVTMVLEGEAPDLTGHLKVMGAEIQLTGARVSGTSVIIDFDGAGFGIPGPFTMTLEITGDRADGSGDGPPGPYGVRGTRVSGPPEGGARAAQTGRTDARLEVLR
jgi:imidazolonepropionase-like amidohydrolase